MRLGEVNKTAAEVSLTRNERLLEMSAQKEPRYCCVPHCSSPHNEQVSSHRFPTDRSLRDKWVAAIKRACNGEEFQVSHATLPGCQCHKLVSVNCQWILSMGSITGDRSVEVSRPNLNAGT